MLEKTYDFFKKYNFLFVLSLLCLFINNILVLVFKNTAVRQTFSCRFLVLIAAIVGLLGTLLEFFNVIFEFVKEKNKLKFALQLLAITIVFDLLLWGTIKFFLDFEIYFVHNNETNLIVSLALVCMSALEVWKNFSLLRQNVLGSIVTGVICLVAIVMLFVTYQASDVSQFYIFAVTANIALLLLNVFTKSRRLKTIFDVVVLVLGGFLVFCTFVANLINRTATDVYNMVHLFVVLGSIFVMLAAGSSLKLGKIVPIVLKAVAIVLCVFVFAKVLWFDRSLKDFDLSRLLFLFVFPILFGVLLKNKPRSVLCGVVVAFTALAYAISSLFVFFQKNYETKLYIIMLVFLALYAVFAIAFCTAEFVMKKKSKDTKTC